MKSKNEFTPSYIAGLIGGAINALFGILFIIVLISGIPAAVSEIPGAGGTFGFTLLYILLFIANAAGSVISRKRRIAGGVTMFATSLALLVFIIKALFDGLIAAASTIPDLADIMTIFVLVWILAQLLSFGSAIICLRWNKGVIYAVCIFLTVLSLLPFFIMIINSTRNTPEIQQHAVALLPSSHIIENWNVFAGKSFNPFVGFINSLIISTGSTVLAIYFSTLTAYALFAYRWKMRQPFFTLIMAVMMIPAQITSIGFYHFMYQIGMKNNFLALIIPAIAAPMVVFFMRQYMLSSLNLDIVASARIDGAGEFRIFNGIVLPIMKPAMATQAIFSFVFSWNSLFLPMILLTDQDKYTMPIMVSQLKGDIYRTEYGTVYLALTLSVLPLFIIYFALSRYIVAGVALGSVKE